MDFLRLVEQCPGVDGWGTTITADTTLNGVPYAPFSKGDKLGRMADWTSDGKDRDGRNKNGRNFKEQQAYGAGHAPTFNAPLAEDEASFSVVSNVRDTGKAKFTRGGTFTRGGRGASARLNRVEARPTAAAGARGGRATADRGGRGGARGGRRFGWKDYDRPMRNRDATVSVKSDWVALEEIDFNRLGKLNLDADEGEDVKSCGFVYSYDRTFDRSPTKGLEKKLQPLDRSYYNPTTSQDPIIQELAASDEATIFATENILSTLMCAPRSVNPWDIVILKQGGKIFFDKRDNAALDLVTVNENAAEPPMDAADGNKDTVNQHGALAEEATYINHNFTNQVVIESESSKVNMEAANPFYNSAEETDPPASKAYKYRRFDLSSHEDQPIKLIVRTEVDAVVENATTGQQQFVTVKALNEFDSKAAGAGGSLDWRSKLASQRGAVLATEMKNNSCKLARWTTQSILSNVDLMKVGFVSRANPRQNDKHVILGVIGWKPRDFARQMNLSISNGWGIVRTIADMCLQHEDGKFVLAKDPNKPVLHLYQVPANTFEEEEEDEVVPAQEDGDDE